MINKENKNSIYSLAVLLSAFVLGIALGWTKPGVSSTAPSEAEFISTVRQRTLSYLYTNQFETDAMRACLAQEKAGQDPGWFAERSISQESALRFCGHKLGELRNKIRELWPQMRVALALHRPKFRESLLLPDASTRIDPHPRHLFLGAETMPPLSKAERREALRLFQAKVDELEAEYVAKNPRPAEIREQAWDLITRTESDRYVTARLEPFRQAQLPIYIKAIAQAPVLALIPSMNPSIDELDRALGKIRHNSETLIEHVIARGLQESEIYAQFLPIVRLVVDSDPTLAIPYESWKKKVERHQLIQKWTKSAIAIALMVVSVTYSGQPGLALIGAYQLTEYIMDSLNEAMSARSSYHFALSTVLDSRGITDITSVSQAQRDAIFSALFVGKDVVGDVLLPNLSLE